MVDGCVVVMSRPARVDEDGMVETGFTEEEMPENKGTCGECSHCDHCQPTKAGYELGDMPECPARTNERKLREELEEAREQVLEEASQHERGQDEILIEAETERDQAQRIAEHMRDMYNSEVRITEQLQSENTVLREGLEKIRDYGADTESGYPEEIAFDEFAYRRIVDSYRDAALQSLSNKPDSLSGEGEKKTVRVSIEELEAILQEEDDIPCEILPNGRVTTKPTQDVCPECGESGMVHWTDCDPATGDERKWSTLCPECGAVLGTGLICLNGCHLSAAAMKRFNLMLGRSVQKVDASNQQKSEKE